MTKGKNFSCNNVSGKRNKNDFYETPYSMTKHLLEQVQFDKSLSVLEPAAGNGAITKILSQYWSVYNITQYDIEKDFLTETNQFDYIITNPPFSIASEFILKAKQVATNKIAMLLPLNYLHGKNRFASIWQDKEFPLASVNVFVSYAMLGLPLRDDGKITSGMITYAWFVWDKSYSGDPVIKWLNNTADIVTKDDK